MAADLKNNSLFQRVSLVFLPDCLVKLEHQSTKDRVRKVMYNRVERVAVWRRLPWIRMLIATVVLGLIGLPMIFLVDEFGLKVVGMVIVALGLLIDAWYLWRGKTIFRITYGGKVEEISGIFPPGKVRRLVAEMRGNILRAQGEGGKLNCEW